MSWGWGDYWGALCVVLALALGGGLSAGWWVFLLLAGVVGYVGLNVLQGQLDRVQLRRPYDQERDR